MTELEKRLQEKEQENMTSSQKEYHDLLAQIVKGAQFIESIDRTDQRYDAAMKKYNRLCEQAQKLRAIA